MTLNYKASGSGKKQIIFIHGNSQSLEYWKDVTDSQVLQAHYSLIAIDLPGHGNSFRSNRPEQDYSLKGLAAYVKLFLEQFDITDYILVAHSLAANILGEMEAPFTNCRGIMLIGSSALGKGLGVPLVIKSNPNMAICFTAEYTEEQLNLLVKDSACNLPAVSEEKLRSIFKNTDPALRTMLGRCLANQEYGDELQHLEDLKVPLAVVYGAEEKICIASALESIPFPKWKNKVVLIPGSGHCSQADQPEKLAELIKEFAGDCFRY